VISGPLAGIAQRWPRNRPRFKQPLAERGRVTCVLLPGKHDGGSPTAPVVHDRQPVMRSFALSDSGGRLRRPHGLPADYLFEFLRRRAWLFGRQYSQLCARAGSFAPWRGPVGFTSALGLYNLSGVTKLYQKGRGTFAAVSGVDLVMLCPRPLRCGA
jgi:hypothetical protein